MRSSKRSKASIRHSALPRTYLPQARLADTAGLKVQGIVWHEFLCDDMFGPGRCMFGSHLPIARLSRGFGPLFEAYRQIVRHFTLDEQDQLFRKVAADCFASGSFAEMSTD